MRKEGGREIGGRKRGKKRKKYETETVCPATPRIVIIWILIEEVCQPFNYIGIKIF